MESPPKTFGETSPRPAKGPEEFADLAREVDIDRLESYLLSKRSAADHAQKYTWYDPRYAWTLLLHPSPKLSALHVRRRARMLSAVCIVFFIVSVISNAMSYANHEPFPGVRAVHTVLNAAIIVAYAFSRLERYQIGADILTFGTWLLTYVHACADLASDKEDYHTMSSFYTWLYTPAWMFFAVLFGTPMRVIALVVLDIIALFNLPAFTDNTFGAMPRILLLHASCDMAIILSVLTHSRDVLQLNKAPTPAQEDAKAQAASDAEPSNGWVRGSRLLVARLFYNPADAIKDRADRRRSRVLSVMLLYLMLTGGAWAYLHSKLGDIPDEFQTAIGAWIGACVGLYILSRTRFTRVASFLTVVGVYLVPFCIVWANHWSLQATLPLYLAHSTLAALLATMLLRGYEMMAIAFLFLIPTFFADVAPFPPTSIITLLLCACSIITLLDLRDMKRLKAIQNEAAAKQRPIWFGERQHYSSKLLRPGKLSYLVFGSVGALLVLLNFIAMGSDVSASRNAAIPVMQSVPVEAQSDAKILQDQLGVHYVLRVSSSQGIDSAQQYLISADNSLTEFVNDKPLPAGTSTYYFDSNPISGKLNSVSVWLLGGGARYSQTAQIQALTIENVEEGHVWVWPASDPDKLPLQTGDNSGSGNRALSVSGKSKFRLQADENPDDPTRLRVAADSNDVSAGYLQWTPLSGKMSTAGMFLPEETMALWQQYRTAFGINSWTKEDLARFVDSMKEVYAQNERLAGFTAALNEWSILDEDTFIQKRTGLVGAPDNTEQPEFDEFKPSSIVVGSDGMNEIDDHLSILAHPGASSSAFLTQALPTAFDWRTSNGASILTSVKNQGGCGSCWSFAAAAAMESINLWKNGVSTDGSTQQFIDCCNSNYGYGSMGCDGGWYGDAFTEAAKQGSCTWTSYPYQGLNAACRESSCSLVQNRPVTNGWKYVSTSEDSIMQALMTYGPLAIALSVDSNGWNVYRSGVLSRCSTVNNHAVLLVGWGTDSATGYGYWTIKNSWGTSWGESGYLRLYRNGQCFCGMCQNAAYVQFLANPSAIACPAKTGPTYSSGSCPATASGGSCSSITCPYGVSSGSMTVTCSNGVWSAIGSCNAPPPSCPAISAPAAGSGSCPITASGGSCSGITCLYGTASGTLPLTCSSGVWSSVTCVPPACPAKTGPTYSSGSCPATASGSSCSSITCPYGVSSGSMTVTCSNGAWSAIGSCKAPPPSCPAISAPAGGSGSCPATASGGSCSGITCPNGIASGKLPLTCSSGVWSSVTCVQSGGKSCPAITGVTYGSGTCPVTAHGGTCQVYCTYGVASGSTTVTCNNGNWCCLTCKQPTAASCPAARGDGVTASGSCPATPSGYACTGIKCIYGLASGSERLVCTNGQWSYLSCIAALRSCPAIYPPANGQNVCYSSSSGSTCTQACPYGVSAGSTTRTCSNGSWSSLACKAPLSCPPQGAPVFGSGDCPNSLESGGSCDQQCAYGVAGGTATRQCVDGQWSALQCVVPCPAMGPPRFGTGYCRTGVDGDTCAQSCSFGAPSSGSETRSCSGGSWSSLVCPAGASCPALAAPANGAGACPTTAHGATCTQSCQNGIANGSGPMIRKCNNGAWSPLQCAGGPVASVDCQVSWSSWSPCSGDCQYDWALVAKTDGKSPIAASFYTGGTGSPSDAHYAVACNQFDLSTYPNAVIRVTMGSIVDYFQANDGISLCDLLTVQGSSKYSNYLDGPFATPSAAPPGQLGGSGANWPASFFGGSDQRGSISSWGGGSSGGCCVDSGTKAAPGAASWGRAFAIHLLLLPGVQSRTGTITKQGAGMGQACPDLSERRACSCPVDGGWSAFSRTCSAKCNGGVVYRGCNNPAPGFGGASCVGPDFQFCGTNACSPTAGVTTVLLPFDTSNVTASTLPGIRSQIAAEIGGVLKISPSWISVLSLEIRDATSIKLTVGIDSGSDEINNQKSQKLAEKLKEYVEDPTSPIHLDDLYPNMAGAETENHMGYSPIFIVEVAFGCVAGVLAIAMMACLFGRMYQYYRADKDAEWGQGPEAAKDKPMSFDLAKLGASSSSRLEVESSDLPEEEHAHPPTSDAPSGSRSSSRLHAASTGPDPGMSANWERKWDARSQHYYYWNKATNVSQWVPPQGAPSL